MSGELRIGAMRTPPSSLLPGLVLWTFGIVLLLLARRVGEACTWMSKVATKSLMRVYKD